MAKKRDAYINHTPAFLEAYFRHQYKYLFEDVEDEERFFIRISQHFPTYSPEYKMIKKAHDIALSWAIGKHRENGQSVMSHFRAVALIVMIQMRCSDADVICACLLHDIVEDDPKNWNFARIERNFNARVAAMVEEVSHLPKEYGGTRFQRDQMTYKRQRIMSREGAMIKIADRFHNLFTLWPPVAEEKRMRIVYESAYHYCGLAEYHGYMYWDLRWMIDFHESRPHFTGWINTPTKKKQKRK